MLFELRTARRVELLTRAEREARDLFGVAVTPRVLRRGERVAVVDVEGPGFLCVTRHGRTFLPPDALRPPQRSEAPKDL